MFNFQKNIKEKNILQKFHVWFYSKKNTKKIKYN